MIGYSKLIGGGGGAGGTPLGPNQYETAFDASNSDGSFTVTVPQTDLASGDLLVAYCGTENSESFTTPTGWTRAAASSGTNPSAELIYKTSDGTEASVTFATGTSSRFIGCCVNLGDATYDTSNVSHEDFDDPTDLIGVTVANNNSMRLAFAHDKETDAPTNTADWFDPPPGFTQWFEASSTGRGKIHCSYLEGVSSGPTGDTTFTNNEQPDRICSAHFVAY